MIARTVVVSFVLIAMGAVAWAERKPPSSPIDAPVAAESQEEGFAETTPPDIGLPPGEAMNVAPGSEQLPAPETASPGPPPMPEWWSKAKMQLDQEIAQTLGSGEATPQTNAAPSSQGRQDSNVPTTLESFGKGASAFCIVIALILLTYYVIGRYGRKTPLFAGANLGTLMGRLFLSPKACLYFIRVKDKVLVVGVTPTSISSVAEMDASAFDSASVTAVTAASAAAQSAPKTVGNPAGDKFLSQLKTFMRTNPPGPRTGREDDEIATLRGDIARLRRELQEGTREQGE